MGKIGFFNVPAHGHVNPTMAVVAGLVERGEHVVYYSQAEFRAKIEAAGAEFRVLEPPMQFDREQMNNVVSFVELLLDWSERLLPDALHQIQRERLDCVIHDSICPWGRFAGELSGVPDICSIVTAAIHPSLVGQFVSPLAAALEGLRGSLAYARFKRIGWRLRRRYGVSRLGVFDMLSNFAGLNVLYMVRDLQPKAELFDERFRFVGPSVPESQPVGDFPLERLEASPVVYIALGTVNNNQPEFYRKCIAAFGGRPETVVMSIGADVPLESLGPLPPNFIVRSHVPQIEVLKRTHVFIMHGGMNSSCESMFFGVPVVVFPQSLEQKIQANRLGELGAGRVISADIGPDELRRVTLETLRDPAVRAAVHRLQDSLRAAGGAQQAVNEILAYRDHFSASKHAKRDAFSTSDKTAVSRTI